MKSIIFSLMLITRLSAEAASDTVLLNTRISDVTVFFTGAQISRQAEFKIKKGKNLFLIDNLPHELNPQSIQTASIAGCEILSVKHTLYQQNIARKSEGEKALEHKVEAEEHKLREMNNRISVYEIEEKLLMDNSTISKDDAGTTVARIKEAADFYRVRLNEIRLAKLRLSQEQKDIQEKITDLYIKLNEQVTEKRKTCSRIYILVDCKKENTATIRIDYYVSSAGWEPGYDFRVNEITEPFQIVYNANVYQSTGEEWKEVNIRLSSHNPALSGDRKKLLTWYIERKNPYKKQETRKGPAALKGSLTDAETGEAIPFANVVAYKNGNQVAVATTDLDGRYAIKPLAPGRYTVKSVYVGYEASSREVLVKDEGDTHVDLSLQSGGGVVLSEVEVVSYKVPLIDPDTKSGQTFTREDYHSSASKDVNSVAATTSGVNVRGGREGAIVYYVDGTKENEIETIYTSGNSIKLQMMTSEYAIETPYTIPSDGSDYNIRIKDAKLPAHYRYHSVPKLESDVFLSAHIANWSKLNLFSGKASIYFQGTFVGQTFLDAEQTGDTLSVSLGRDKDVVIVREGNKMLNDKKTYSSSIKETVGMNIIIRNNKNVPINITVEDQFPITERKSIEVELGDHTKAKVNSEKGLLTWNLHVAPEEKKSIVYNYSVKYPKWSRIVVE